MHFKKNVHEKLRSLGLPTSVSEQFLADIFGQHQGPCYQEGLVDCGSEREFDDKLESLKEILEKFHMHLQVVQGFMTTFAVTRLMW